MKRLIKKSKDFSDYTYKETDYVCFINPTFEEWKEAIRQGSHGVRGICSYDNDVYITSGDLVHAQMTSNFDPKVPEGLHFEGDDNKKIIIRIPTDNYIEELKKIFKNCRSLYNYYNKNTIIDTEGTYSLNNLTIDQLLNGEVEQFDYEEISYDPKTFKLYSIEQIKKMQNKLNWYFISEKQILSEDFIREFQNKVDWYYISKHQKLSENFIREFQNRVYWMHISEFQVLSEPFIEEFQNKVKWNEISQYQVLSKDFIIKFKDKIKLHYLRKNENISPEIIEELSKEYSYAKKLIKKSINNKEIRFIDIYDFDKLMAQIPFNAENLYHIKFNIYGFTHDVGIEIILTPIRYGEEPTGWDNLEQKFNKTVKDIQDRWKWNEDFGYH